MSDFVVLTEEEAKELRLAIITNDFEIGENLVASDHPLYTALNKLKVY